MSRHENDQDCSSREDTQGSVRIYWIHIPAQDKMRLLLAFPNESCQMAMEYTYGRGGDAKPEAFKELLSLSELSPSGQRAVKLALRFLNCQKKHRQPRRQLLNQIAWRVVTFSRTILGITLQ